MVEHELGGNDRSDNFVEVVVLTTSGTYPASGTDRVPANQKVRQQLRKAANELGLTDTDAWVAKVGGREIDPEKSYVDNQLTGTVRIDWGPREGGGGA